MPLLLTLLFVVFGLLTPAWSSHIHSSRAQQSLEELIGGSGRIERLTVFGRATEPLSPTGQGRIYYDSDTNTFQVSENGGAYVLLVGASGGAPANATYITQTTHAGLSAEQALNSLTANRLLRNTTGGVLADSLLEDDATNVWLESDTAYFALGASADVRLFRDAANILARRNGTTPQTDRFYSTFTDASNYERFEIVTQTGDETLLRNTAAGSGIGRTLRIMAVGGTADLRLDAGRDLLFQTSAVTRFFIDDADSNFKAFVDNTYDIGATGALRPRAIYVAGSTGIRHQAGTGTLEATMVGVANVNVTAVGNVGVGEDDLITYPLPANSLSANNKAVEIKSWGTTANNVNAKTLKCYFGTQVVLTNSLAVSIAGIWSVEVVAIKTGANTQDIFARLETNTATVTVIDQEITAGTQTDTGAITIKCTGEATDNNDIVHEVQLVKFLN